MADLIKVKPGPNAGEKKAILWEQHPDHPDGEVFIKSGSDVMEVARTQQVALRIKDGYLTVVDEPAKKTSKSSR